METYFSSIEIEKMLSTLYQRIRSNLNTFGEDQKAQDSLWVLVPLPSQKTKRIKCWKKQWIKGGGEG